MTTLVVEAVVSQRTYGTIFAGRVDDMSDARHGRALRVRATSSVMIGEPEVGERWRVEGDVADTAWGEQISATSAVRIMPTGRLVRDFLANHVGGIGADRAMRLWAAFGTDLPKVLRDGEVDALAEVIAPDRPVLAPRLAIACVDAWRRAGAETHLVEWLGAVGVDDVRLVRRINRLLGDTAVERLDSNPWVLVPLLQWPKVDALGLKLRREARADRVEDAPDRLIGAVDSAVQDVIADGATMVGDADLRRRAASKLSIHVAHPLVAQAVEVGVRHGAVVAAGEAWRAPGCALMEEGVTARLRALSQAVDGHSSAAWVSLVEGHERAHGRLHPEQRAAIVKVLTRPLACLQGGAGVGKTHTTRAVCDVWEANGGSVLLTAIAGKAALRLSRATGRLARTLARTFGDLDRREATERDEDGQGAMFASTPDKLADITSDTLVVVDEASMVDLGTMHGLLRRMPEGARLLMVGDERQLPPVGFGLIYHRLVRDEAITARLSHVHRQAQGSQITVVAAELRERRLPALAAFQGRLDGVSHVEAVTRDQVAAAVVAAAIELGVLDGADVLIVAPTNADPCGTTALNRRLHDLHRERDGRVELRSPVGERFSVEDPVLFRRNDYQRSLFNGSLGRVLGVDVGARTMTCSFDGEQHELGAEDLLDVSLGYVMTCHRAQGSQASRVVVALPPSRLLDPSWVYTAVTRAERQVVLVGATQTMTWALSKPWADQGRMVGFDW